MLVVDLDCQGICTRLVGKKPSATLDFHLLKALPGSLAAGVVKTSEKFDILPSNPDIAASIPTESTTFIKTRTHPVRVCYSTTATCRTAPDCGAFSIAFSPTLLAIFTRK